MEPNVAARQWIAMVLNMSSPMFEIIHFAMRLTFVAARYSRPARFARHKIP